MEGFASLKIVGSIVLRRLRLRVAIMSSPFEQALMDAVSNADAALARDPELEGAMVNSILQMVRNSPRCVDVTEVVSQISESLFSEQAKSDLLAAVLLHGKSHKGSQVCLGAYK